MSQHSINCAITGMALWALAASGCSLVTSPSEYEPAPGSEQPDTEQPDARQPSSGQPDARQPSGGQPDAGQSYPPGVADAPVIIDCGQASTFRAEAVSSPVMHMIGLYESPLDTVNVNFALPGTNVLILSAYETVTWNVTLLPDGALGRILLIGSEDQIAGSMPNGVQPENVDPEALGVSGCGFELPPDEGTGCDTTRLIDALVKYTTYPLASYDGCYSASQIIFARSSP